MIATMLHDEILTSIQVPWTPQTPGFQKNLEYLIVPFTNLECPLVTLSALKSLEYNKYGNVPTESHRVPPDSRTDRQTDRHQYL